MKFGYIRKYSGSKSREDQYEALKNEGCKIIKEETADEPKHSPIFLEIIEDLHNGDALVVENILVFGKDNFLIYLMLHN